MSAGASRRSDSRAGSPGAARTLLNGAELGGRFSLDADVGDRLRVETPGGGGDGKPPPG